MQEGRIYNTGKHMWRHGEPARYDYGKVTHRKLGPCPRCGHPTVEYGGGFSCNNRYCRNNSSIFVCNTPDSWPEWWNKDINVVLDGNAWCAHDDEFINLQESIAGFGDTPGDAVIDFIRQKQKN